MGRAGLPATITLTEISDETRDPAQATASLPMDTPGQTIVPAAIQTPEPIMMGAFR